MPNKNSTYIGSLTSFILDTKPYHSKLTEVQEIYQFFDEMNVHFDERLFSTLITKAAWPYSYFSGGNPESIPGVGQPVTLHQLVSPLVRGYTRNNDPLQCRGAFKVARDEIGDLGPLWSYVSATTPASPLSGELWLDTTSNTTYKFDGVVWNAAAAPLLAFDPHQIQGAGLSDAFIQRNGSINLNEPMLEGHDVFLSKGAYVFQIKQTVSTQPLVVGRYTEEWEITDGPFPVSVTLLFTNADALIITGPATQTSLTEISVTGPGTVKVTGLSAAPNYAPQVTERQKENVLAEATATVQINALDLGNPNSAVNQITAIINQIAAQLVLTPNAPASAELAIIQTTLSTPLLPNSYEGLLNALVDGGTPVIAGYVDWIGQDITAPYTDTYVNGALSALSPGLYFNMYTDVNNRESAALEYADIEVAGIQISNIASDPIRPVYEEWTLAATTTTTFLVQGSSSGSIGTFSLPSGTFTSPQFGFSYAGPASVPIGTQIVLTPQAEITVHYEAPLEAWSLIKTNPRAYSRPVLTSTRYGFVRSQTLQLNYITILDTGLLTTTIVLTATSPTTFALTSTGDPLHVGTATVNVPYNDGKVAFTIVTGSAYAFTVGDKFYVEIENLEPFAEGLDLYYGYDFDPYDAETMVYNTISNLLADYLIPLDFGFDSRFIGYDLASFDLVLAPNVVPDLRWRLRAVPNLLMPLNLHPLNAPATAINEVSVIATDDPLNPFAILQVDMVNDLTPEGPQSANDPDTVADLLLYYATSFELEYFDDGTSTWISVDNVPINVPYVNATHGFSFTIVQAGKPFIAAELHSSWFELTGPFNSEILFGGDTIAWTVRNDPPVQLEAAPLTSRRVPRLIMYGDSYHFAIPAQWTMAYVAPSVYALQGIHVGGVLNGQFVFGSPITVNTTDVGRSYKNDDIGLHYTVVNGAAGLAPTDTFTFTTYERKPTYLVHGSVSGWQPDAAAGEWYWNGKIGFKIPVAEVWLFDIAGSQLGYEAPWTTVYGQIELNYLRPDARSATYRIKSHALNHWTLYRDGALVGDGDTVVADKYISVTMPNMPIGTEYVLSVRGQDRPMALGHDLAIVRTTLGRQPTSNDFILLERNESDTLSIAIKPTPGAHSVALQPLAAVGIAGGQVLLNVDHFATSGVPLEVTSPETAVLQGWLPLLETRYDKGLSIAEFSDAQSRVVVRAAATGETIGEVLSLSTNPAEPVIFRWDVNFHTKYLPLNAEATIVTLGSGMDDRVNVNMTDNAMFLISGGGLAEDAMFAELMSIGITDESTLSILSTYEESTDLVISDGPFVGFLPGYDNLEFDFETGLGDVDDENSPDAYYDAGVPLTDWFQQAQGLSLLPSLTAPQQALLNDLLGVLGPWLDGDILTTTLAEFITNIGANPPTGPVHSNPLNWTPVPNFGIPAVGMGMQIETDSGASVGTNIVEGATILVNDFGYAFDQTGYDLGEQDAPPERSVVVFSAANPPVPVTGLGGLTTYAAFETPLFIAGPGARVIELSFSNIVVATPAVYLWRPADAAPSVVPIVERLSDRRFRFSLPSESELKVIVV